MIKYIAAVLLLSLTACGFQPLYAERGAAATEGLKRIEVAAISVPDLVGPLLQRRLVERLVPIDAAGAAAYRLTVRATDRRQAFGIQIDASVTRYDYVLETDYRLISIETGKTLYSGEASTRSSYNVVTSQFATLSAEQNAREKAARDVAATIELELALYFSERGEDD